MDDNNGNVENQDPLKDKGCYSNAPGTGVWASMIFMIITFIGMYFLAKFFGN